MYPVKVGVIGCGNISGIYFQNLKQYAMVDLVACADLDMARAKEAAAKHQIRAESVEVMLADTEIELIVNLTIPKVHAEVSVAAIKHAKHVYVEKPLSVHREDGARVLEEAKRSNVLVGSAPDTFLGGAHQTCRMLIDQGEIGRPVAANAFMMCHGHETWHPSPEFYYEAGGGPMLDMGPYYLTAMINMLGPVIEVAGMTSKAHETRTITSQPKHGKVVDVEVPTHLVGVLRFAEGLVGQITTSFDVWHHRMPAIEVYGTEGTLAVPDPNGFGGAVRIRKHSDGDWVDVEIPFGFTDNSRGVGVLDMAYAIRKHRPHRASGALAYHVLDVMQAVQEANDAKKAIHISSGVDRPQPMPLSQRSDDLDG